MNSEYMSVAVEQAQIGALNGEIPVGAVIIKNNKIIATSYNTKENSKCSINHAEILAIQKASEIIGDWRLNECDMYLTMEPCLMCYGALIQARIRNVYYLLNNEKFGSINNIYFYKKYNHTVNFIKFDDEYLENKTKEMLKSFFLEKR